MIRFEMFSHLHGYTALGDHEMFKLERHSLWTLALESEVTCRNLGRLAVLQIYLSGQLIHSTVAQSQGSAAKSLVGS
jgi:hypothetical protein